MRLVFRAALLSWGLTGLASSSQAQRADSTFAVDVQQYSELYSAATSPQGKVAVLGRQAYTDGRLLGNLTVFDSQGQVDLAFQQRAGFVEASSTAAALPALVRFYADGRLLLASSGGISSSQAPQVPSNLLRLLASGTPDYSFQFSPTVALPNLRTVAIQPDGKILLAGSGNAFSGVGLLVRLNSDGTLDTGFSATIGGRSSDYVAALAVQPDGKILVGGYFVSPAPALIRLLPSGQRDPTFQANVTSGGDVQEILLRPGGQIIVASPPTLAVQGRARGLQQLLPDGSLDPGFAAAPGAGTVYAALRTSAGRVVAAGSFYYFVNPLQQQLSFVAFTAARPLAVSTGRPAAGLAAYPNPAHAQLHLRLDAAAAPKTVTLLDALGRPVLTQRVTQPEMRLATAALPPGTYFLRVDYITGPVSRRVMLE